MLLFRKVYTNSLIILICTQVYALDFAFHRARRLKKRVKTEAMAKRRRATSRDDARQFAVMETHPHKNNETNFKIASRRVVFMETVSL